MKACTDCGRCCIKYGDDLATNPEEIRLWELFRPDIHQYVHEGRIWVDPDTREPLARCPFLVEREVDGIAVRYQCAIYPDRPEDCRAYPSTVAEMVRDGCEMIEVKDLEDLRGAEAALRLLP